jgi:ribonuclease HII
MLKARHTQDSKIEAGIDEAGRGSLWGPLCAAAVIWPPEESWTEEIRKLSEQIRDSKKVTPKRRAVLEPQIQAAAVAWAVGYVQPAEIDQFGMTKSNRLAFQRAISGLAVKPERLLIDGILTLPDAGVEQIVEPKADGLYIAVAAASILAKEAHDRCIREAVAVDPSLETRYALESSKGYGTAKHRLGIQANGMHAQHRRLFLRTLLGITHETEASQTVARPAGYAFVE